ncbi:MAG: hypothetical protein WD423_12835 [Rhodothermales bacterium]
MKRALLTAFLTVALVGAAQAQSNLSQFQNLTEATADVTVLTTIIQPITANTTGNIDFGIVEHDPSGTTSGINALETATLDVTAFPGSTIDVEGDATVTLNAADGGGGTVTFNPAGPNTDNITIPTGGGASATRTGIDLSGTLSIDGNAFGGYNGTYTLTFNYSSI